jgi:hypothetical protein
MWITKVINTPPVSGNHKWLIISALPTLTLGIVCPASVAGKVINTPLLRN